MRISGLSASSYDTYSWCEWKWFLQQVLGFEDQAGAAAYMGTMAHKVLELLSKAVVVGHPKESKAWDVDYLWKIAFNHYFNEEPALAEQIEPDKLKKVCKGIHDLLNSEYTPIRHNTISAELAFNIEIKEPDFKLKDIDKYFTLRGRIDRVDQIDEETIEVVDYKTGSRVCWNSDDRHKKTPEDLFKDIQPKMYHLASKHLYPWAKNCLVTFIYITDGGPVTVPFIDEDLLETKEIIKRRLKTIQANINPERNLGWKCKLCTFSRDGTCDNVWDEKDEVGLDFVEKKYRILNNKR
jgi:hypothetical protein